MPHVETYLKKHPSLQLLSEVLVGCMELFINGVNNGTVDTVL